MDHWRRFYVKCHVIWGVGGIAMGCALLYFLPHPSAIGFLVMAIWPLITAWHMGRRASDHLWEVPPGEAEPLIHHLHHIRNLDLIAFILGFLLCLSSIFISNVLINIGLPLTVLSAGTLILTLKTQWEVALLNRLDD